MEKARKAMSPLLSIIPDFQISCGKSPDLFHSFMRPIALYNSENMTYLTLHQIRAIEENKTTLGIYEKIGGQYVTSKDFEVCFRGETQL